MTFMNKLPAIVQSQAEDPKGGKYSTVNLKSQQNRPSQPSPFDSKKKAVNEYASTIELGHHLSVQKVKRDSLNTFDQDRSTEVINHGQ